MAATTQTFSDNFAVFPTKRDLELWASLSRDQQEQHFKDEIQQARNSGIGTLSAEQIKQKALDSLDE